MPIGSLQHNVLAEILSHLCMPPRSYGYDLIVKNLSAEIHKTYMAGISASALRGSPRCAVALAVGATARAVREAELAAHIDYETVAAA